MSWASTIVRIYRLCSVPKKHTVFVRLPDFLYCVLCWFNFAVYFRALLDRLAREVNKGHQVWW